MIVDHIRNLEQYAPCCPALQEALQHLNWEELMAWEEGRHEIPGSRSYGLLRKYQTTARTEMHRFEAHKKYADLQIILHGREIVAYADTASLKPDKEYNPDLDCSLFCGVGKEILLTAGEFILLFPQDAHIPKLAAGGPVRVVKAVVKIPMEASL